MSEADSVNRDYSDQRRIIHKPRRPLDPFDLFLLGSAASRDGFNGCVAEDMSNTAPSEIFAGSEWASLDEMQQDCIFVYELRNLYDRWIAADSLDAAA